LIEIGLTTTNAGLTYNSTTSTFTATNINATSELRVGGNLISTTPSQWITSGANIYYSSGNVGIGTTTNSSDDGNANIAIPDSTFYVRGERTAGATTNICFRGGLEGNSGGKVRIWMSSDAAHSCYIQSEHTAIGGGGNTLLTFGTANGNALPIERMRIDNIGNVGIGTTNPLHVLHLHKNALTQDVKIFLTDNTTTSSASRGFHLAKSSNSSAAVWNCENAALIFGTNNTERMRIAANGAVAIQSNGYGNAGNMAGGSLTIGNISQDYGGGTESWNTNTSGLMMECADNTEIAVHDNASSIHSFMRYTTTAQFTIGRNMGHGVANVAIAGSLTLPVDRAHNSSDGKARYYYITNGASLYWGGRRRRNA